MTRPASSEKIRLFAYFISLIIAGSLLLWMPQAWNGPGRLGYLDALFIAASAACLTGLHSVDISMFSVFGRTVILALIQIGGLGVIVFTTIHLLVPGFRTALNGRLVRTCYAGTIEQPPRRTVRHILVFAFAVEALGAGLLYAGFSARGLADAAFSAVFHSISGFCNAGLSIYIDNLQSFRQDGFDLCVIMALVTIGGFGFMTSREFLAGLSGKYRLTFQARVVLIGTLVIVLGGTALFYVFEAGNRSAFPPDGNGLVAALFQSVAPRSSGFNLVDQAGLTLPSKLLTMLLMFIGAAPGSTAGGIRITTFFVVLMYLLRRGNQYGEIVAGKRRLTRATTAAAGLLLLKSLGIVSLAIMALSISESPREFVEIAFEAVSAFGSAGLTLGLTPTLSGAGKVILICTMFAGRVGFIALAMPIVNGKKEIFVYPEADVIMA